MRFLLALVCVLAPAAAEAQWYAATFTGGNSTKPSTITIERPEAGMDLEFLDVHYDAKPLKSPQYYGARLGWMLPNRPFGIEAEFLHIKVYARTNDAVHVRGTYQGAPIDTTVPMNSIVARYNTTHGLNFLFANLVARLPLGDAASPRAAVLAFRAGVGPIRPGVDVVMPGLSEQDYQFAGFGAQAAAGIEIRLKGRLGLMAEYKFTRATPELEIGGGTGRSTSVTHHVAVGIRIGK